MYRRNLKLPSAGSETFFLWGPRQTGKSTLLRAEYPDAFWIDLLKSEEYRRYLARPETLREELDSGEVDPRRQIVIDEIQKVPVLLDEVHWLIENRGFRFALCGSSARKLRRGAANLLGGRALRFELHGITGSELGKQFDLDRLLNRGYLPRIFDGARAGPMLEAYVTDYRKRPKRRVIGAPKFYFADVGVVNRLARRGELRPGSELYGKGFENWVFHELTSFVAYRDADLALSYWRLASGIEVDFILGDMQLAIEAKASERVTRDHLKGLRALVEDHPKVRRRIVVCREPRARRTDDGIEILPVKTFVRKLWEEGLNGLQ